MSFLTEMSGRIRHTPQVHAEVLDVGGVAIKVELGVRGDHSIVKALHAVPGSVTKMSAYYPPHEGHPSLRYIHINERGIRETQFVDIAQNGTQLDIIGSLGEFEEEGSIINLMETLSAENYLYIPLDGLPGFGMQVDCKNIVFNSPAVRLQIPTYSSDALFHALKHPDIGELHARGLVSLTAGTPFMR